MIPFVNGKLIRTKIVLIAEIGKISKNQNKTVYSTPKMACLFLCSVLALPSLRIHCDMGALIFSLNFGLILNINF